MKFQVINKETNEIVSPRNYYFVIRQDGELWTVNHDLSFTKADEKYEILSKEAKNKTITENEAVCLSCKQESATHGIGQTKTLCSKCWNGLIP